MLRRDPDGLQRALRLYLVLGPQAAPNTDGLCALVGQAIEGGVSCVQWRDKRRQGILEQEDRQGLPPDADVVQLRALCRAHAVPFLVNDQVALARAVQADGVHLGQDDCPPARARALLGAGAIIGLSVGSDQEAKRFDPRLVDYVGVGPVFPTTTKPDAGEALGWREAQSIIARNNLAPAVLIGGINAQRLKDCHIVDQPLAQGYAGCAVVSAITNAQDPRGAAKDIIKAMPLH